MEGVCHINLFIVLKSSLRLTLVDDTITNVDNLHEKIDMLVDVVNSLNE